MYRNYGRSIVYSNCHSFEDRQEMTAVMESNSTQLDATLVNKIYMSAIQKTHVFDTFEDSKGDVTKFDGYANMVECLNIMEELSKQSNVAIPEISNIKASLNILAANRDAFIKGFLVESEMVILIYNTILMACVEATSIVISSYVDYLRSVDKTEITVVRKDHNTTATLHNLELFVEASRKGDLDRILKDATANRDNFLGVSSSTVVLTAVVIGAAVSIVPIMRELAYLFYYTRSRLSDYLEHQALLVEINSKNLNAPMLTAAERKAVAKKQEEKVRQLREMSAKLKFQTTRGEKDAKTAIKEENRTWTIENTKSDMVRDTSAGDFQLL